MIHIYNGCVGICKLPGKACGACATCLADCGPKCEELCQPCSEGCEDFLNRPLGGYVAMASWLSILEIGFCGYCLLWSNKMAPHEANVVLGTLPADGNGTSAAGAGHGIHGCVIPESCGIGHEVGILNWIYAQMGLAVIHLLFAFYVQARLLRRLKEVAATSGDGAPVVVSSANVKDSFKHVFLYDIGVCLYVFLLAFQLMWGIWGLSWTQSSPSCDPHKWPSTAAQLGSFFFWFVCFYSAGWWGYMGCLSGGESLTLSHGVAAVAGVAAGHSVPGGGTGYQYPGTAAPATAAAAGLLGSISGFASGTPSAPPMAPALPPPGFQRCFTRRQLVKFVACVGLDLAGSSTYFLPGIGESLDFAYAPAQAVALKMLFNANNLALLGLAEELLPFTDVLPTATIAWFLETFCSKDFLLCKILNINQE